MKEVFLLLCGVCILNSWVCTGKIKKVTCNNDVAKRPTLEFIKVINELKLCRFDTAKEDDSYSYGYCDSNLYKVYSLSSLMPSSNELLLIQVSTQTQGGIVYDNYILEKSKNGFEKLNYFGGMLNCIKPSSNNYSDIIFFSLTDHGRVKVQITRKGKYYHRKSIIDVEGSDVTKRNKKALLKRYNMEAESHVIEKW